ncbi:VF530 family protein [uncultured Cedecea sp.]|uniref:VF530 family protein n=1 Tax=uncultured Cedecea sp. TaxID=988762 RepID=UPI002639768A|nr:VF530 family protein [uncultured Cedecea sp.]
MSTEHARDPLHGVTLEALLNQLVDNYGWERLAKEVKINCFKSDPSIKSSLKFLRRTPWARTEVETLYLNMLEEKQERTSGGDDSPWANWQKKGR